MSKQASRRSAKSGTKVSASKKVNTPTPGRSKPMTPKAGVTLQRKRVKDGGEWCW